MKRILSVTVKPSARSEGVEKLPDGSYRVLVKAPPVDGRANEALISVLAVHFSVPKSSVRIMGGFKGKKKRVEVFVDE